MPLTDLKINFGPPGKNAVNDDPGGSIGDFLDLDTTLDPPPAEDKPSSGWGTKKPSRGAAPKPSPLPKPPAPPVSKAQQKEVAEELGALVQMAALFWSVKDPVCSGALSDQSAEIATALTKLLSRNPRLLAMLRGSGWMGEWGALFLAVKPVATAIYRHHLAPPDEEDDTDDGFDPTAPRLADFPAYIPRAQNLVGNASVA